MDSPVFTRHLTGACGGMSVTICHAPQSACMDLHRIGLIQSGRPTVVLKQSACFRY